MFKLSFCLFALGTFMYVSSISADPIVDQQMIAEGMKKMQLGLSKAMEKLKGRGGEGGLGGAMGKLTEIASKISGRGNNRNQQERAKRSLETHYTETRLNKSDYRKVEMSSKRDNDVQVDQKTACLVKDNEIYWLELVTTALIHITQEMKKVLHGKTIATKMSGDAYH